MKIEDFDYVQELVKLRTEALETLGKLNMMMGEAGGEAYKMQVVQPQQAFSVQVSLVAVEAVVRAALVERITSYESALKSLGVVITLDMQEVARQRDQYIG